jgi:hypothetical protein
VVKLALRVFLFYFMVGTALRAAVARAVEDRDVKIECLTMTVQKTSQIFSLTALTVGSPFAAALPPRCLREVGNLQELLQKPCSIHNCTRTCTGSDKFMTTVLICGLTYLITRVATLALTREKGGKQYFKRAKVTRGLRNPKHSKRKHYIVHKFSTYK